MKERLLLIATGITLLTSCGSDTAEPGDEEPIAPPPQQIIPTRMAAPTLAPPTLPQQAQQSIFRTPDITTELPAEKELLSRPVSSPTAAQSNSNN